MTVQDVGLSFLCPDALYAVHGAVILKVFSINKESFFSDRNVSIPKIKPASDASKLVLDVYKRQSLLSILETHCKMPRICHLEYIIYHSACIFATNGDTSTK